MHLQEALATQRQVSPATLTRHWKRMGYVYKRTRSVPAGHRSQDFRRCFACWLACGLRVRYLPHYSSHLNGMETMWRCVKGGLVPCCYYGDVASLCATVVAGLKQLGGRYNPQAHKIWATASGASQELGCRVVHSGGESLRKHKQSNIVEQVRAYIASNLCFVHYPYPVERPYDTYYQLTWTHSHRNLLFVEWNKTDLFVLCEPEFDSDRGLLYACSAIISKSPQSLHLLVPAELQIERTFASHEVSPSSEMPSEEHERCALLCDWLNHSSSRLYIVWLYDASLNKYQQHRVEGPVSVHCGVDYAIVFSDAHLCLWRGGQTNFTVHSDILEISEFAHGIVAEVLECRFAVQTATAGSRLHWEADKAGNALR